MLAKVRTYCKHATPVVVRVPVRRAGTVTYYSRVIMSPCGKCEHCRRAMQNHWSSRLYFEALRWNRQNYRGKIFFCTFTISNEWFINHANELVAEIRHDMPKFVFDNDVDQIQNTRTAKYIYREYWKKKLLDMLRLSAEKRGVGLDGLKYYTCCEFGDRTERIHFHSILYIKDFQPVKDFCHSHGLSPKKPWFVKGKNLPNSQKRLATLEERYMETLTDYLWSSKNDDGINESIGFTNVNHACAKSFRYITKYVCKLKEDEDVDKCPFHRQSRELGLDIDEICNALLNNKPFYDIQTSTKTYKCSISKYYRKKYSCLLGIDDIFTENWLAQSNRLFREHRDSILFDDPNRVFITTDDLGIDIYENELEHVQEVQVITLPVMSRRYKIGPKGRKIYEKDGDDFVWEMKIGTSYLILDDYTLLNGFVAEKPQQVNQPNYEFEKDYINETK